EARLGAVPAEREQEARAVEADEGIVASERRGLERRARQGRARAERRLRLRAGKAREREPRGLDRDLRTQDVARDPLLHARRDVRAQRHEEPRVAAPEEEAREHPALRRAPRAPGRAG